MAIFNSKLLVYQRVIPNCESSSAGPEACAKCGSAFAADANFCRRCGAPRPGGPGRPAAQVGLGPWGLGGLGLGGLGGGGKKRWG